ncbi:toll/interleukin-1 receptor domain-containing protein [Pedobacter gandavensis]|uniref:TIR domain-containing protein n=1 Tax=Pedobacter gandavensis TaxID=2679963 RepID=A0ABR6EV66_9SPHI|nr:pentapeptide repeat-containing protein [Pedobacter gandavensis]MBB2148932.1 TIR domain-containing protein [Pedobacter gandavensis]
MIEEGNLIYYDKVSLVEMMKVVAPKKISGKKGKYGGFNNGIYNHSFFEHGFNGKYDGFIFKGCKFTNCIFENIFGFFLYFKDCEFHNCDFRNSRFSHGQFSWTGLQFEKCRFRNVEIDEGDLDNAWFYDCYIVGLIFLGETMFNVNWDRCHIENSQFQSVTYYSEGENIEETVNDLCFNDCEIVFSHFISSDFRNSKFDGCRIYLSSFVDCVLSNSTFELGENPNNHNYASIDFQSILKSELSDQQVLKEYFNIKTPHFKEYIQNISNEIAYRTIFISYSFKDGIFAKAVSDILQKHGATCFLWEKDAPGGVYLEDIMKKNVQEHETLLFISSQHSLKSKACQFELSQGRKKQEETWNNTLFPIHIDNFLFEVQENQIRPVTMQKEYWENICELRRTNSKDFSSYSNGVINSQQLEKDVINHILKFLRTS